MNRTPYLYRLTDTFNGKWYIGINTGKGCCPEKLGVSYFTSSLVVAPIFKANPDRFVKEMLAIGKVEYIVDLESRLLNVLNAKNDQNSYNMHNGDGKMNTVKSGILTADRMKREGRGFFSEECKSRLKVISRQNAKLLVERKLGAHSPETRAKISAIGKVAGSDNVRLKRGIFSESHDRSKRKEPWWHNKLTCITKRSYTCPGEGFEPGRGVLKKKEE